MAGQEPEPEACLAAAGFLVNEGAAILHHSEPTGDRAPTIRPLGAQPARTARQSEWSGASVSADGFDGPPIRLLVINYEYPPLGGGSSPVTLNLAETLAARGHKVDVLTAGFGDLPRMEENHGVRVMRVRALRSRMELCYVHEMLSFVIAGTARARRLCRQNEYDVCHVHFLLPTGLVPFLLHRRRDFPPYVVTCHGSDVPGYNPDRFRRIHTVTPPLLAGIGNAAEALIAPSSAMEKLIAGGIPGFRGSVLRIPYGIDAQKLKPAPKEPKILVAARLFQRKGVSEVIEVLRDLPLDGYTLEVAGDGPERRRLESLARQSGVRARFHGWLQRPEMDRLFARCSIFVLATQSDNFPSSLLEAMAAGCAIITTRAGGCPEVVGDAGMVVDQEDPRQLRDSLRALTSDPELRHDLGARARARVLETFGWHTIAAAHEVAFREAIGRRARERGNAWPERGR